MVTRRKCIVTAGALATIPLAGCNGTDIDSGVSNQTQSESTPEQQNPPEQQDSDEKTVPEPEVTDAFVIDTTKIGTDTSIPLINHNYDKLIDDSTDLLSTESKFSIIYLFNIYVYRGTVDFFVQVDIEDENSIVKSRQKSYERIINRNGYTDGFQSIELFTDNDFELGQEYTVTVRIRDNFSEKTSNSYEISFSVN